MKKWIAVLCLITVLAAAGCAKAGPTIPDPGQNGETEIGSPDTPRDEEPETPGDNRDDEELSDFSMLIEGKGLALMDWDNKVNLEALLGKPLQEEVHQLGPGSDTFQGSYVKKIKYAGLELELFSPKDNGKSFWVRSMLISDSKFETARGIKTGDGLEKLQSTYPELEPVLDNRKDPQNMAYMLKEDIYNYIFFEVNNGSVAFIKIYHEFA